MDQIRKIISKRLGLRFGGKDVVRLREMLTERSEQLSLGSLQLYAQFLLGGSHESEQEWEELTSLLTTGETYFFRDEGQIRLLRTHLLPDLINKRSSSGSLRIWSAGCASGEEAYTIAILLDDLLPTRANWKITILGTDVDNQALTKAETAVYTDWSFRNVCDETRSQYFHRRQHGWQLDQRIKRLVSFQRVNLLTDSIPNTSTSEMDLIICRNVFIYFKREHIASVFNRFVHGLRDGGYLLTGHGELQGVETSRLRRRVFDESIVYQKATLNAPISREHAKSAELPSFRQERLTGTKDVATSVESDRPESIREEIEQLLQQGQPRAAIERSRLLFNPAAEDLSVLMLLARAHADLANHGEATALCEKAIKQDAFAVAPHFLLAKLAEAESDYLDAKSHLKRVLYLDPTQVVAHLELAGLFDREGEPQQARKNRLAALDLLKSLPDDEKIELHGDPSVFELREHLQRLVHHG